MPFEILAVVTNEGKARIAEAIATGKSFKVDHFALTSKGHLESDPTIAKTPDPAQTTCDPDDAPPSFYDAIDSYSYTGTFCPEFTCTVSENEAVGRISSLCLIGTIVYSPTPGDPEIGVTFLFAVANMPLWIKTDLDSRDWKVTIHF